MNPLAQIGTLNRLPKLLGGAARTTLRPLQRSLRSNDPPLPLLTNRSMRGQAPWKRRTKLGMRQGVTAGRTLTCRPLPTSLALLVIILPTYRALPSITRVRWTTPLLTWAGATPPWLWPKTPILSLLLSPRTTVSRAGRAMLYVLVVSIKRWHPLSVMTHLTRRNATA